MEHLIGLHGQLSYIKIRSDDDFVDKLNHRYTTFILIIFAIVVSTKQYVGEPINCWCPAQFTDNHEDFTNKFCWVSNTYYVPITKKHIPEENEPKLRIGYYQWVPMILLAQAMLFYLPCMVWRFFNNRAGLDLNNLVEASQTLTLTTFLETRDKTIRFMAKHMHRYLGSAKKYRRGCLANCRYFMSRNVCMICGRKYGNFLSVLYLMVKVLYLANAIGQLFLLNSFIGSNYHVYGYEVIRKLWLNEDWGASERFPRVTMCDFHIRTLANIQRHTVQCVLPINLFNEKLYIFIWFWTVLMAMTNCLNFLTWVARILFRSDQNRYIKHHLKDMGRLEKNDFTKRQASKFIRDYLRLDGVLICRIIGMNTNELVVGELVDALFNTYVTDPTLHRADGRGSRGTEETNMIGRGGFDV